MGDTRKFVEQIRKNEDFLKWEMNTTAGVDGYNTPNAFAASEEDSEKHNERGIEQGGYNEKPDKKKKNTLYAEMASRLSGIDLNEVSYKDYKSEDKPTVRKIGESIHEISKTLREIELAVGRAAKLKTETRTQNSALWKSSVRRLSKINERIRRIESKIRDLGS